MNNMPRQTRAVINELLECVTFAFLTWQCTTQWSWYHQIHLFI